MVLRVDEWTAMVFLTAMTFGPAMTFGTTMNFTTTWNRGLLAVILTWDVRPA